MTQHHHPRSLNTVIRPMCPTPRKYPYSTKSAAKRGRQKQGKKLFSIYQCKCGSWHLTKRRNADARKKRAALAV